MHLKLRGTLWFHWTPSNSLYVLNEKRLYTDKNRLLWKLACIRPEMGEMTAIAEINIHDVMA